MSFSTKIWPFCLLYVMYFLKNALISPFSVKGSFARLKTKQNKNTRWTGIFLLEVWKCLSDAFWPLWFLIRHRLLILFGILCTWSIASLYFHELLFVSGFWQSDSDVCRCESPCTLCEIFWALWMLRNHSFRYSLPVSIPLTRTAFLGLHSPWLPPGFWCNALPSPAVFLFWASEFFISAFILFNYKISAWLLFIICISYCLFLSDYAFSHIFL